MQLIKIRNQNIRTIIIYPKNNKDINIKRQIIHNKIKKKFYMLKNILICKIIKS